MSLGEGWQVYLAESLSDTLRSGLTRSNITRWSVWSSGQRVGWGAGNLASTGSVYAVAEDSTKPSPVTFYHPSGEEGRSQSENRHVTEKPMVKVGEIQLCMAQVNPRAGWWAKRNRTQQMITIDRG